MKHLTTDNVLIVLGSILIGIYWAFKHPILSEKPVLTADQEKYLKSTGIAGTILLILGFVVWYKKLVKA